MTRSVTKLPKLETRQLALAVTTDGSRAFVAGGQGRDVLAFSDTPSSGQGYVASNSGGRGLRDVMVAGDEVWVCGEYGHVARSVDGGASFTTIHIGANGACLYSIRRDDAGALWVVGDRGLLKRSTDGETFVDVDAKTTANLGRLRTSAIGPLIATSQGGMLLVDGDEVIATKLEARGVMMTPLATQQGTLMVVGVDGQAYRSADMGESFERVDPLTTGFLSTVAALEDGTVAIVGADGHLAVSSDDGRTFAKVNHDAMTGTIWCCAPFEDGLLMCGESGQLAFYG